MEISSFRNIAEISSFRNIAELGMEDPFFSHQWPMSSLEELNSVSVGSGFCEDLHHSYTQQPILDVKRAVNSSENDPRPMKQLKTTNWTPCRTDDVSNLLPPNSFQVLNSGFSGRVETVKPEEETWSSSSITFPPESIFSGQSSFANQNMVIKSYQEAERISTSTRLAQSLEHVIAERKRRENLSQKFIVLSTLIPGLKKLDRASVLGDAIKHMKQLQDKVKTLEEQNKTRTMETTVFVKKYEKCSVETSSSDKNLNNGPIVTETVPEIEARFCNKDVLIGIHCEKRKGMLERTVAEIEKLHLSVVNSSVMSFGDSALNITIVAQKDEEFALNMKEAVKKLRIALKTFI